MLLYSQNPHSQGAKRLARELGIRRIRHNNSRFRAYRGRRGPYVVNWGASELPAWGYRLEQMGCILNVPRAVQRVSNKLTFFDDMFDVFGDNSIIPNWTTSIEIAREMLEDGTTVVERHVLNGSGGRGIRIVSKDAINPEARELQEAPLYVQYIPKKAEYRVHVCAKIGIQRDFFYVIISIQQKVARAAVKPLDWKVRNHVNGFIYQRENIAIPHCVREVAIAAMRETNLHFGAVDVIYNERRDRAYVLEINTAPGLEGQTVQSYTQAIREFIQ